ncbi:FtsX-like permease family protein [Streptomyces sp. NPDC089919]|uniref:ABC transporter permease n=1 Tax=Streptomyces sp. NPDC089919 TaxID=3155188 RepID=UPI003431DB1F
MSAVWRASRAAVRRRRLQTLVIGLVVLTSSVALVVALGLISAASAPFDDTFGRQRGAHASAVFDSSRATGPELRRAAQRPGVTAVAGPFPVATFYVEAATGEPRPGVDPLPPGPVTVVGRPDPSGAEVDRVDVWSGRWATAPGEIVLMRPPAQRWAPNEELGSQVRLPGAPPLTIVGFGSSISRTANAWVAPAQMPGLHPTSAQLLYRFDRAGTDDQVRAGLTAVSTGLRPGALLGSQSYLTVKQSMTSGARIYIPFLTAFGVLGLVVAVLIVANVVSGAVVSGYRHIGVLKAVGFTPNQVVGVYLVMVLFPGLVGSALGTAAGVLAADPLLKVVFSGFNSGYFTPELSPWTAVVTLLGMPVVVALAALLPALRAHRLPAVRAISAGSAPSAGRGLKVQRWLGRTRLPRPVSLGVGQLFARPARTAMTLAALVLGVTTVTLATGLTTTVDRFMGAQGPSAQSVVYLNAGGDTVAKMTTDEVEALLRRLPGARHITPIAPTELHVVGESTLVRGWFTKPDRDAEYREGTLVKGRWTEQAGEIVAPGAFLKKRGLGIGDHLTLERDKRRTRVTVVGETLAGDWDTLSSNWQTLTALNPAPVPNQFYVELDPGTDVKAYNAAARTAEPALNPTASGGVDASTVSIVGSSVLLTVLLGTVAALGVFNTVLLNTRERRRDLGMLKSIGMTPRQVTAMVVVSMAALGVVGGLVGLPLGMATHHVVVTSMAEAMGSDFPPNLLRVWQTPGLTLLTLAGVAIAVLGALLPARSAARLTIAEVLRSE